MKKIVAVCGMGLGSSFMVELNIKNVINDAGINGYEVTHSDVSGFDNNAEILVVSKDLDDATKTFKGKKILLTNIIDKEELKTKLLAVLK